MLRGNLSLVIYSFMAETIEKVLDKLFVITDSLYVNICLVAIIRHSFSQQEYIKPHNILHDGFLVSVISSVNFKHMNTAFRIA